MKFVVSPNAPVRQIWVSAMARSYKLSWAPEAGVFALDGETLPVLDHRAFTSGSGTVVEVGNHVDDAVTAFRRAVSLRDDYAEAHANLGAALREQGDIEGAVSALQRASSAACAIIQASSFGRATTKPKKPFTGRIAIP